MRYCIKTIHMGRSTTYGDDWVDIENQHFTDDLNEAIAYADDQCRLPKTIQSSVFVTSTYDQVYDGVTKSLTSTPDQHD
jgi:hypothetical protein